MPSLGDRVAHIEKVLSENVLPHIEETRAYIQNATTSREEMKADIGRVLAVVTGAEKVGGFVKRYGPKAIYFGAGLMTTLGVGNPEVWQYIKGFFGG